MHIESDRALIPAHTPAVRYLSVTISAPDKPPSKEGEARPAANVALVLDRSGSMDGEKIELARTAVAHAIRLLNARDRLAIVVYDDRVDTVLESAHATKEAQALAQRRLAKVSARGSTDLGAGWEKGCEEVRKGAERSEEVRTGPEGSGEVRRVLLLTDGLTNHGIVDHDELRARARAYCAEGISTSTFGLGADFDEQLLSSLATQGGGHFYFIESPKQIPDLLASELGETLDIVARDALFEMIPGPGADVAVLTGQPVEQADGRLRVRLGDMVAGQEITLILAVACPSMLSGSRAFVDCRVSDRDNALFAEPMRIEWLAVDTMENEKQPVNRAVLHAVASLLAERARATALSAARHGDHAEALKALRHFGEQIRVLAPADRVIHRILDELRAAEDTFSAPMDAVLMKQVHMACHAASFSRDPKGQARRR